jgi:hypothetical protein
VYSCDAVKGFDFWSDVDVRLIAYFLSFVVPSGT